MQLTLIPEKSWWVWNDRKYVSQLTQVVMMANICLQTYLVSNLSALLTRADVGIYTMRCLVLLSTNEGRSFNGHVSCHLRVNCGKCFGSFFCHQSSVNGKRISYVNCFATVLIGKILRTFLLSLKDASKMQCLEVRWCSIWFDIAGKSNFFARFGKLLVASALRKGVASALRLFQNFRVTEAREGLNKTTGGNVREWQLINNLCESMNQLSCTQKNNM